MVHASSVTGRRILCHCLFRVHLLNDLFRHFNESKINILIHTPFQVANTTISGSEYVSTNISWQFQYMAFFLVNKFLLKQFRCWIIEVLCLEVECSSYIYLVSVSVSLSLYLISKAFYVCTMALTTRSTYVM